MRWLLLIISISIFGAVILSADDVPEGKGKDTFLRMCSNCHEIERVTGTKNSKKQWTYVVDDMVSRGAEGSDEDVASVIGYLARNFGQPLNINSASAKQIEAGLSFTPAQAETIVKYRTEKGAFKTYEELLKVPGLDAALLEEQKKNIVFQPVP